MITWNTRIWTKKNKIFLFHESSGMQAASITVGFISDSNQHRRHEGETRRERRTKNKFIASKKWTRGTKKIGEKTANCYCSSAIFHCQKLCWSILLFTLLKVEWMVEIREMSIIVIFFGMSGGWLWIWRILKGFRVSDIFQEKLNNHQELLVSDCSSVK